MRLGPGRPFAGIVRRDSSQKMKKKEHLLVSVWFCCRAEHLEVPFERIHEQIGWGGTGASQNRRHRLLLLRTTALCSGRLGGSTLLCSRHSECKAPPPSRYFLLLKVRQMWLRLLLAMLM